MSNLVDNILKGINYVSSGQTVQQQRALNQQTLADNQYALDVRSDRELGGRIRGSDIDPFLDWNRENDPTKPLVSFDVVGAFEKNPALALEVMNSIPKSMTRFYDENGKLQQGRVSGIQELVASDGTKTGKYAITIARPDGKKTKRGGDPPMTRGASSGGDDEVIVLTRDQLNGMATDRVLQMNQRGAFAGGESLRREMAKLGDAVGVANAEQRAALLNELDALIDDEEVLPEIARGAYEIASSLDGEELIDFATNTLGLDLAPVFQKLEQDLASAEEGEQTGGEAPKKRSLTDTVLGGIGMSGVADAMRAGAAAVEAGGPESNPSISLHRAVFGKNSDKLRGIKDEPAETASIPAPVEGFTGAGSRTALKGVQDKIAPNTPQHARDYSYENLRQRLEGTAPVDTQTSSISPELAAAPVEVQQAVLGEGLDPEVRKAAILQAIKDGFAAPTEKQVEYAREYMLKNGYVSPESLSSAPPQEVANIAFTLASMMGPETTMDQRLGVAQSILNYAQFGAFDTSPKEAQTLALRRRELQIEGQKEARLAAEASRKSVDDEIALYDKTFDEAQELMDRVSAAIPRNKRGFVTGAMGTDGQEALNSLYRRLEAAQSESRQTGRNGRVIALEQAYGAIMPEAVMAFALHEPRANLGEWIIGPALDLFARAPYREMNTDFGSFYVTYDKEGRAKDLYVTTPKGTRAESGQINMTQLRQRFGNKQVDYILSTIEKTQELKQAQ